MGGNGIDLVVYHQLKALAEAGFQIDFLSRGRFHHKNVRNICLPYTPANLISFIPSGHYYNAQNRFFSSFGAFLLNFLSYQIIISWTRQSLSLFRKAKRLDSCCVLNNAGCHYNFPLGTTRWNNKIWPCFKKKHYDEEYSLADSILVASEIAAESFLLNGFSRNQIYDIGRGANLAQFKQGTHSNDDIFRVVFFGRVCERKGIFHLIKAWKLANLQKSELWIIGDVPKEIESKLKKDLPINAKLYGFKKNPELYLQKCQVQMLLSRTEGMAKSLIEGAACGLVTITTCQSGFPVIEGETGFVVDREDSNRVADLLQLLQANRSKLKEMAKNSRLYVEKKLSWNSFHKRFLSSINDTYSNGSVSIL